MTLGPALLGAWAGASDEPVVATEIVLPLVRWTKVLRRFLNPAPLDQQQST